MSVSAEFTSYGTINHHVDTCIGIGVDGAYSVNPRAIDAAYTISNNDAYLVRFFFAFFASFSSLSSTFRFPPSGLTPLALLTLTIVDLPAPEILVT